VADRCRLKMDYVLHAAALRSLKDRAHVLSILTAS
jgi:hypothetical protein